MSTGLAFFIAHLVGALVTLFATAIGIAYANGLKTGKLSQKEVDNRMTVLVFGTLFWPIAAIILYWLCGRND